MNDTRAELIQLKDGYKQIEIPKELEVVIQTANDRRKEVKEIREDQIDEIKESNRSNQTNKIAITCASILIALTLFIVGANSPV